MNEATRTYVLIGSLALNAFGLGVATTMAVRGEPDAVGATPISASESAARPRPGGGGSIDPIGGPQRLLRALPPQERRAMVRRLVPRLREARGVQRANRDAQARIAAILTTEPFEPEAFRQALEDGNAAAAEMRRIGSDAMAMIVERMDAEARRQLADRILQGADDRGAARLRRGRLSEDEDKL